MDRATRIRTIQRVGRALSDIEWADASLTLSEYGIPYAGGFEDYDSRYEYMLERLRQGSDEMLREIDRSLHEVGASAGGDGDPGPWRVGSFRLFISHTSENRARAWKLAEALRRYGVAAFVAHDEIKPTKSWETEILRALRTCDALCALLTEDFVRSAWCDQEVGYVLGRGRLVIPLRIDADPHGFIHGVQAVPVRPKAHVSTVVHALLEALLTSDLTAETIAPVIVRRYAKSGSGDAARDGLELLGQIRKNAWTPEMIEEVGRAPRENVQVREAGIDGRSVPEAAAELVSEILGTTAVAVPADDDIPF